MDLSSPVKPTNNDLFYINGIRQTLIALYHPRSNGEAERFVQIFKNAIKQGKQVGVDGALCQFLLKYRTTPYPSAGVTPSQLMFNREIAKDNKIVHTLSR